MTSPRLPASSAFIEDAVVTKNKITGRRDGAVFFGAFDTPDNGLATAREYRR
jgi:hypothetical protein